MSSRVACSFVALLALARFAPAIRADVEPTEVPTMPTVETADACRFTVPAKLRPEVIYRVQATFNSDREQGLSLYVWAQDDDKAGHWEQRAAYNSYFSGRSVTAELALAPGRTYLLAGYFKKVRQPGYGQPWLQSGLHSRSAPEASPDTAPAVLARFAGNEQDVTINATLTPIELPQDQSNAGAAANAMPSR